MVSEVMGRVIFWRMMTQMIILRLTQMTATVSSIPEDPDAPCVRSLMYSGVVQVNLVD